MIPRTMRVSVTQLVATFLFRQFPDATFGPA
jgi:hypothetical protein